MKNDTFCHFCDSSSEVALTNVLSFYFELNANVSMLTSMLTSLSVLIMFTI